MVSGPITSWQIDEETMGIVRDFILGGSKITAVGDCSHEIIYHLTDNWSLRAEARAAMAVDSPCGMEYSILAGVQYSFGD